MKTQNGYLLFIEPNQNRIVKKKCTTASTVSTKIWPRMHFAPLYLLVILVPYFIQIFHIYEDKILEKEVTERETSRNESLQADLWNL